LFKWPNRQMQPTLFHAGRIFDRYRPAHTSGF